jgi:general secretion pathway protein A
LLVAGAERTDIFTPEAVDYIFRCSDGIPRNINNLCDNALLAGYAAGDVTIGRSIIEDVADTFDMLPRSDRGRGQRGEEREEPARIFSSAGRAELWNAGKPTGESD